MRITRGTTVLSDTNPVDILLDVAAASGTDGAASRADHVHEVIDPAAPVTQAFGDAAAAGTGINPAREDHVHGMPPPPPVSMFIYPASKLPVGFPYTVQGGDRVMAQVPSTSSVFFMFEMPDNYDGAVVAKVIVNPNTTELLQWDTTTDIGAVGEAPNVHQGSDINATQEVTANVLAELDVASTLSLAEAGDYVGLQFASDTSDIDVLGLSLKFPIL